MSTLLISDVFPPAIGGSGRWFWELYRRLPRDEFVLAVGQHPGQQEFDRGHDLRVERAPLRIARPGLSDPGAVKGYWRALSALERVRRRHRINMVHAGRCLPEGWIALLLRLRYGLPYLCYVHGEEIQRTPGRGQGGATSSRELRWMTWVVLRRASLIIANSWNSARILNADWRLPTERIRVLHPGVDTDRFVPAARGHAVRARLGWGSRPVVLTVGRLQRRKGHDLMIAALGTLRTTIPDVLYAIVGDGEERQSLERLVARQGLGGYVRFMGELDDDELIAAYQQCDLFVLPNRQIGRDIEGFGMVLLEAQACGRPVVAGASGGTAETMRIPETGRIVDGERHDELAALVSGLLGDPGRLETMGQAARRWATERFEWARLVHQAREIFAAPALAR